MKIFIFLLISCSAIAQSNQIIDSSNIHYPILDSSIIKANIELREAFKPFADVEKYGLGIIKYIATGGYSTTGASFKIYNPNKKTIKYIWFTVAGENPVGDLVKSGGVYYKTLRGIGPVKPYSTAEWDFEYVWFTDIVEYLKISTIKLQFMDGTFKTIKYGSNIFIGEDAYNKLIELDNKNISYDAAKEKKHISEDDQTIFTIVDQSAEFNGGISNFRNKIASQFTSKETGTATISFFIEKDGSMVDILVSGQNTELNNEISIIARRLKLKWTPAKINNTIVRQKIKIPITIN